MQVDDIHSDRRAPVQASHRHGGSNNGGGWRQMAPYDFEDDIPDPENEAVRDSRFAGSERKVEKGEGAEEHSVPERLNTEAADDDEVDMTSGEREVNAVTAATVRISLASM